MPLLNTSMQGKVYMTTTGGRARSKFTDIELEYLQTQRLGRLATINKNGEPQIAPVTFRYYAELDTIDIGGLNMGETQKYRNVAHNGLASFVVDDVLPLFQPRGIEIRGHAQALPDGGQQISPNFSPALIRLTPERILSWNLISGGPAQTHSARNV
jgi:pyridoxamine 5'-phosphate oxidase family protein